MCRLFGLTAGTRRVAASFWLLDAPDSLSRQSERNPDGTGLGTFDEHGRPVLERQPLAADRDPAFAAEARRRRSATFVAHVRHSSGTPIAERNTHPFEMDGLLCAHNGEIGGKGPDGLAALEEHLGADMALVAGDTDSERMFALVAREARDAGGDVGEGIARAVRWIDAHLPVLSANLVITTADELWALRWPAHHRLWVLDRSRDPAAVDHRSSTGTRIVAEELADVPFVAVASEPMDGETAWRDMPPGELLHVDRDLRLHRRRILG